jgi:hypothetical protein
MGDDKTPAPDAKGDPRTGSDQKPAGGQQGGSNDTKAPKPGRR